jgi:hypothetical protein
LPLDVFQNLVQLWVYRGSSLAFGEERKEGMNEMFCYFHKFPCGPPTIFARLASSYAGHLPTLPTPSHLVLLVPLLILFYLFIIYLFLQSWNHKASALPLSYILRPFDFIHRPTQAGLEFLIQSSWDSSQLLLFFYAFCSLVLFSCSAYYFILF